MKYVLIVMYMFTNSDGQLEQVQFTTDFPSRDRCMAAIAETETKVLSRVETRALTLECRPMTPWDDPIALEIALPDPDSRVAANP